MDDFPFYEKMKSPATQLFLGVIVVACIYYDAIFGFITGLVVLLIYYEIYKKIITKAEEKQKITKADDVVNATTSPNSSYSFMGAHQFSMPTSKHYSVPSSSLNDNLDGWGKYVGFSPYSWNKYVLE